MSARSAGLDLAEYEALLRADLAGFAERAFCELYPQTEFLASWHHRVIAAKLQAVFEGRIRRLIINKAYEIDNIAFIFHPAVPGRSVASLLGTRVECQRNVRVGQRGDAKSATPMRGCGLSPEDRGFSIPENPRYLEGFRLPG